MVPTPSPVPKTLSSEAGVCLHSFHRCLANHPRAASNIFRGNALNRVIYNVVSVDIRREQRIWQNPWEDLTEDYNKGFKILDSISYVIRHLGT